MREIGADSDHKIFFSAAMQKKNLKKMQMRHIRAPGVSECARGFRYTATLTFLDRPDIRGVKSISQSKINLHAVLPNKPGGTRELACTVLSGV